MQDLIGEAWWVGKFLLLMVRASNSFCETGKISKHNVRTTERYLKLSG